MPQSFRNVLRLRQSKDPRMPHGWFEVLFLFFLGGLVSLRNPMLPTMVLLGAGVLFRVPPPGPFRTRSKKASQSWRPLRKSTPSCRHGQRLPHRCLSGAAFKTCWKAKLILDPWTSPPQGKIQPQSGGFAIPK